MRPFPSLGNSSGTSRGWPLRKASISSSRGSEASRPSTASTRRIRSSSPEAWREVRIGLDVHVLSGPPQGTASALRNLLRHLPPPHDNPLYTFAPPLTATLLPTPHFSPSR